MDGRLAWVADCVMVASGTHSWVVSDDAHYAIWSLVAAVRDATWDDVAEPFLEEGS